MCKHENVKTLVNRLNKFKLEKSIFIVKKVNQYLRK